MPLERRNVMTKSALVASAKDDPSALAMIQSIDEVRAMIPSADLQEVLQIRDQAEAVRAWTSRHKRYQDASTKLSDVSLRATRRAGELLIDMERNRGAATKRCDNVSQRQPTLDELGIERQQSSRWQRIAGIPEKDFEDYIAAHLNKNEPVRFSEALRLAKVTKKKAKRELREQSDDLEAPCITSDLSTLSGYQTIYADPPWQYGNQGTRAATDDHYKTMTVEQICALPIGNIAADEALLWLWTTSGFLRDSFAVIDAWGFTYKACWVWVKPQMGLGNYGRISTEFLMVANRGGLIPDAKGDKNYITAKRGKHSSKPDEFRTVIERISPGPRIELFAREARPGWTAWGNEIERQKFLEAAK